MLRKIIINSRPASQPRPHASSLSLPLWFLPLWHFLYIERKGPEALTPSQSSVLYVFFVENMTHIWLLLWPKLISNPATKCDGDSSNSAASKASVTTSSSSSTHSCLGLKKLVRKLKKQSRMVRAAASSRPSLGSSYDPQSYSLNFDSSGWGSFLDGDHYQFHAFSSRFIANPPPPPPPPRVLVVAASSH